MSYIPQFDAHESTHTKLQESRHIPTLTCLASITRLPTFEEAASGFPNKRKGKFEILFSKIDFIQDYNLFVTSKKRNHEFANSPIHEF